MMKQTQSALDIVATRAAIAPQGGATHIRVTVTPAENAQDNEHRRPVALVLVADRSGSMGDAAGAANHASDPIPGIYTAIKTMLPIPHTHERQTKMSVLRDAAERLIDTMGEQDRFGLITFSSIAQRDLPLVELKKNRSQARAAIRALQPGASTNLQDGLRMGIEQFDEATLRTHICKILVITDGLANVGVSSADGLASIAAPAAQAGITISTVGVGLDYNSAVLGAIARAGNGDYSHIENAIGIDSLLQSELQTAAEVRLRNVELILHAGAAAIGQNLNDYTQLQTANGIKVLLGDLPRARSVWFEITTPVPINDAVTIQAWMHAIAADDVPEQLESSFVIRVTQQPESFPEDEQLVRELTNVLRAQGIGAAAEMIDSGNIVAGQQRARDQQSVLASVASMYSTVSAMPADATLEELANTGQAGAVDRSRMKNLAATNYAQQRGKK